MSETREVTLVTTWVAASVVRVPVDWDSSDPHQFAGQVDQSVWELE